MVHRPRVYAGTANCFDGLAYFTTIGPQLLIKVTSKTPNRLIHIWILPKLSFKGGGILVLRSFEPTVAHLLVFTLCGLWLNHGNWKTNSYSASHVKGDCRARELTVGQTFFLIRRPCLQYCCLHGYIPVHGSLSFTLSVWEVLDDAINLRDERDGHLIFQRWCSKRGRKREREVSWQSVVVEAAGKDEIAREDGAE